MKIRGNQQMLREINKSLLLNLIYLHGPISRVELARLTKLSPTTVSVLVEEIMNEGIIHETGTSGSGVGRKMTMLEINANNGYVVGVDLSKASSRFVLLNLRGEVISMDKLDSFIGEKSLREKLPKTIESFIKKQGVDRSLIKWTGISVPGILDEKEETVLGSKYLQIRDFPLKPLLTEKFDIPIHLVNDIEAASFAERFSGAAKGKETIVYILVDYGIGAGFVINNQIYRGATNQAGKIGDFYEYGIDKLAQRLKTQYPKDLKSDEPEAAIDKYVQLALEGKEPFKDDLDKVIQNIAKYCGNVLQLMNPEQLIISGWVASNEELSNLLITRIHQYEVAKEPTTVKVSFWKDYGPAIGAATLGLHQMFRTKTIQ
ncbi:ROK family transcriptional regulator [Bacillus sp. IITD106]|nr:ROK family transcriptional regulator [Bacillus sp. IITD106]